MSDLAINGRQVSGQLYELKSGTAEQAQKAAKRDGFDEVFFEAKGKSYVIQGESFKVDKLKKGDVPMAMIKLDGKTEIVDIKKVNNEKSTMREGIFNPLTKLGLCVTGGGAAFAIAGAVFGTATNSGLGAVMLGAYVAGTAAILTAGVAVGGAVIGAINHQKPEKLKPFIENKITE